MITDFITGRRIPDEGAEANRQAFEKFLITGRAFTRKDIDVNVPITVIVDGTCYRSRVDLTINIQGRIVMAVKCAAGSLGSRQREILAAARLLTDYPVPVCIVTDGQTALVFDTFTGREMASGLDAVPDRTQAEKIAADMDLAPWPATRRAREAIIFKSYDAMNINRTRE